MHISLSLSPLLLLLPLQASALLCNPLIGDILGDFTAPADQTFVLEARNASGFLYPVVLSPKDNRTLVLGSMDTYPNAPGVPLFHITNGLVQTASKQTLGTIQSPLLASQPLVLTDAKEGLSESFSMFDSDCDDAFFTVLRFTDILPILALGTGAVNGTFEEGKEVWSPILANLITPFQGQAVDLVLFNYP